MDKVLALCQRKKDEVCYSSRTHLKGKSEARRVSYEQAYDGQKKREKLKVQNASPFIGGRKHNQKKQKKISRKNVLKTPKNEEPNGCAETLREKGGVG